MSLSPTGKLETPTPSLLNVSLSANDFPLRSAVAVAAVPTLCTEFGELTKRSVTIVPVGWGLTAGQAAVNAAVSAQLSKLSLTIMAPLATDRPPNINIT